MHAKTKKTKGTIPDPKKHQLKQKQIRRTKTQEFSLNILNPVAFSPLKHQHKAPETCNFSQKLNQEAQNFQHNHLKLPDPKSHNFKRKLQIFDQKPKNSA